MSLLASRPADVERYALDNGTMCVMIARAFASRREASHVRKHALVSHICVPFMTTPPTYMIGRLESCDCTGAKSLTPKQTLQHRKVPSRVQRAWSTCNCVNAGTGSRKNRLWDLCVSVDVEPKSIKSTWGGQRRPQRSGGRACQELEWWSVRHQWVHATITRLVLSAVRTRRTSTHGRNWRVA